MKVRIPDEEFTENARTAFKSLIGKTFEFTVRVSSKTDLRTYQGELVNVTDTTFTMKQPVYEDFNIVRHELHEYRLIDIHYYAQPPGTTLRWMPLRFRKV